VFAERGERSHSIGLGFYAGRKYSATYETTVLAKNDPAIIGVFPHVRLRHPPEWNEWLGSLHREVFFLVRDRPIAEEDCAYCK
jgi:hypothetical protein